ncbi:acylpyruvase FAHD1, mitochondrial isoform X2 [Nilaparvata lugens]|nr:acylpyruvase FAHD1, mitochondrial isoform X2 [Nilaparvata lugens]
MFLKPTSSYIVEGQTIEVPKDFDVYEEVELGVIIGKKGKNIKPSEVMDHIAGYCLALDLTAVDDMKNSRAKGLPWTFGKGFDTACPVSKFIPKSDLKDPTSLKIWCKVNDKLLQDCLLSDMVFTMEQMISYTSRYMTLEPNDLILTGSPGNNGPIRPGDVVEAGLGDIMTIKFPVKSMEN